MDPTMPDRARGLQVVRGVKRRWYNLMRAKPNGFGLAPNGDGWVFKINTQLQPVGDVPTEIDGVPVVVEHVGEIKPPTPDELGRDFVKIMQHRDEHDGRHLHHRNCIHNLPPEEQVAIRRYTIEKWLAVIGPLPEQITPDQWECEPPIT